MSIKVDHDDEGNDLTAPGPETNAGQLIYLLEWARKRNFTLGPTIQIGDVIVQVRDNREKESSRQAEPDIFEINGHVEK